MAETKTFSISKDTKIAFDNLKKLQHPGQSFSSLLGISADFYAKCNIGQSTLDVEYTVKLPHIFGDKKTWRTLYKDMDSDKLKELRKTLDQLVTLAQIELERRV